MGTIQILELSSLKPILTFLDSRDNLEEEEERLETERFKEDDLDLCCSSS